MPSAPGRFSITTVCFQRFASGSAKARSCESVPAEKGVITRTVRRGQWSSAADADKAKPIIKTAVRAAVDSVTLGMAGSFKVLFGGSDITFCLYYVAFVVIFAATALRRAA
jgi:hypothetical protein